MFIANISQPLLGLVDSYLVGHMGAADYLAGVALGAMLITQVYWLCGALRMSATGLSAQCKGRRDKPLESKTLWQLSILALVISLVVFLLVPNLMGLVSAYAQPSTLAAKSFDEYLSIRLWGAPAALMNLVLMGWLIGQQRARQVMALQVVGNLANVLLSVWMVKSLEMGVVGVALATLMAEYLMLIGAVLCLMSTWRYRYPRLGDMGYTALKSLLSLNSAMFIRNLALQACLAFVTLQGARYGTQFVAVNSLLLQFMSLTALGLDAVAYAAEALVGEAKGRQSGRRIAYWVRLTMRWSISVAVLYSLVFLLAGSMILRALTDIESLHSMADQYLIYVILLPVIAHWCFLFDGVYVGLGRADVMRNSMVLSALLGFFAVFAVLHPLQNHGLWLALLSFFLVRGGLLMVHFYRMDRGQLGAA